MHVVLQSHLRPETIQLRSSSFFNFSPAKRNGPDGANLFIFHIPDDYTNMHLLHLFERFGNVVKASISVEASTGRGQGFGFVSYDNPESAKVAIQHLHGFQVSCVQP